MSNNVTVDVSAINDAISKATRLDTEARQTRYYNRGAPAAALHMSSDLQVAKFEAEIVASSRATGFGTNTLTFKYPFKMNFSVVPACSVTYDGNVPGVTVRMGAIVNKSHDTLVFYVTRPGTTKWTTKDKFTMHIIAIGY